MLAPPVDDQTPNRTLLGAGVGEAVDGTGVGLVVDGAEVGTGVGIRVGTWVGS